MYYKQIYNKPQTYVVIMVKKHKQQSQYSTLLTKPSNNILPLPTPSFQTSVVKK